MICCCCGYNPHFDEKRSKVVRERRFRFGSIKALCTPCCDAVTLYVQSLELYCQWLLVTNEVKWRWHVTHPEFGTPAFDGFVNLQNTSKAVHILRLQLQSAIDTCVNKHKQVLNEQANQTPPEVGLDPDDPLNSN